MYVHQSTSKSLKKKRFRATAEAQKVLKSIFSPVEKKLVSRIATVQQRALADGDVNWVIAVLKNICLYFCGKKI